MLTKTLDLFERLVVAIEKIAANPAVPVAVAAPATVEAPKPPKAAATKKTAPAAPATPPAEKPVEKPAETKAPDPVADDDLLGGTEPAVTLEMLLALVPEVLKTVEKPKVKAVIETIGNAARISEIKPDKYSATYAALKALV